MKKSDVFFNEFRSQTFGQLDFEGVVNHLLEYINIDPGMQYELIIGTDSMPGASSSAEFVSALVVHRKRSGGIYFWSKRHETNLHTLRDRIFQEALYSLKLAEQLLVKLKERNIDDFHLIIHVDVGPNGETKKMLHEIVGMIKGNGYEVKTKPESYGASSVADRHT
jgi:uncharacterized protein